MAFGMQIPRFMKFVTDVILSVFLTFSLTATAEEACVKAFRDSNSDYFKFQSDLNNRAFNAKLGMGVAGVGGAGTCYVLAKSLAGAAACGIGVTLIVGGGYWAKWSAESRLEPLKDAHKLFTAYEAYKNDDLTETQEVKDLIKDLKLDEDKTAAAMKEFATLMEWGSLCDGTRPRSYSEALELMTTRMQTPQN